MTKSHILVDVYPSVSVTFGTHSKCEPAGTSFSVFAISKEQIASN